MPRSWNEGIWTSNQLHLNSREVSCQNVTMPGCDAGTLPLSKERKIYILSLTLSTATFQLLQNCNTLLTNLGLEQEVVEEEIKASFKRRIQKAS